MNVDATLNTTSYILLLWFLAIIVNLRFHPTFSFNAKRFEKKDKDEALGLIDSFKKVVEDNVFGTTPTKWLLYITGLLEGDRGALLAHSYASSDAWSSVKGRSAALLFRLWLSGSWFAVWLAAFVYPFACNVTQLSPELHSMRYFAFLAVPLTLYEVFEVFRRGHWKELVNMFSKGYPKT